MKKKPINYLAYIPILVLAGSIIIGYVRFQVQAENTGKKVEELKTETKVKIEKVEADIKEIATEGDDEIKELKTNDKDLEKAIEVNKTQQDNIQAQVIQISEKTDKIYDVLIELKNKKK